MKSLFFSFLVLASTSSHAALDEILTCSFTEPFITVEYHPGFRALKITDAVMNKSAYYHNIRMIPMSGRDFDLLHSNGQVVMNIRWTGAASDGMSDLIYPYSITWHRTSLGTMHGACSTPTFPRKQ